MVSLAVRSGLPAGIALAKAWADLPAQFWGSKGEQVKPEAAKAKLLPSQQAKDGEPPFGDQLQLTRKSADKSFKMHIGASLHIPTKNTKELPQYTPQPQVARQQGGIDLFEGLPFRRFADKLGAAVLPAIEAAQEAERESKLASKHAAEEAEVLGPSVPHMLPFTRWAANSKEFRSTFIAEPPRDRKKVRLSWYHPDDGMVPRDWFKGGLLADIKYYRPFGWCTS